jgi:DNA processing protein
VIDSPSPEATTAAPGAADAPSAPAHRSGLSKDELAAWLSVLETPGIGRGTARRLLSTHGGPQAVLGASVADLRLHLSGDTARALLDAPQRLATLIDATWRWLQADTAHHILTLADADYPSALLNCGDPPLLLYARGQIDALKAPAIAMVGSRSPSAAGAGHAREFASAFSRAGLVVVSGMALGIDAAAHDGALRDVPADEPARPPRTIAVVGTGIDRVYPRRHRELAHRIIRDGLLLTEFALGTPALAQHFPMRNRIIAGLARGTLVVEAALQSGSLITARLATEMGRDVFAIPGSIHSPMAKGCHALIKQGAKLVESVQDVFEEWNLPVPAEPMPGRPRPKVPGAAAALGATTGLADEAPPASAAGPDKVSDADAAGAGATEDRPASSAASGTDAVVAAQAIGKRNALPAPPAGSGAVPTPAHDAAGATAGEASLDDEGPPTHPGPMDDQALSPSSDQHLKSVLDAMGHDPVTLDDMLDRTGLDIGVLSAYLLEMELDGLIERLPGQQFQRIGRA